MDFFHTEVGERSIELATLVLESGRISEGRQVKAFELALQDKFGLENPVAVNSGTSALHLALSIAGVVAGDEVILPAQTFVATGLAVLMQGAKPVFADIDPMTGNLAPTAVRDKITPQTKAIFCVHWGGYPCELTELAAISKEHGIVLIEDAAHALGASYQGKKIGSISDFTAFSFQAIKHLTTGDGGALCCKTDADRFAAKKARWFGIDREGSKPGEFGERVYDIDRIGFKYHMNEIAAALGLGAIDAFPARLARRQAIGRRYRNAFEDVSGIRRLHGASDREHAYWLFTLLVDERKNFVAKLRERNIPASVVHQRIDRNSVFAGLTPDLPGQEEFDARQISIPIHEGLADEDVEHVIATIQQGW